MDQASQALHVALAGRDQNRAGTEEQQALEYRVVKHVKQCGGERQRRRPTDVVGAERERQTKPDEDDADVLDGVISEQPFDVVLHERVEHAQRGRDPADAGDDQT